MPQNSKPVGEIKMWPVSAAIWRNEAFHNVTFQKSYKDGEQYKSTDSFSRDDLLLLSKCADHAHSWILRAEQKAREEATRP